MKVAILILALVSLAASQSASTWGNIDASCSTASGCSLTTILAAGIVNSLLTGTFNLDFSTLPQSGLTVNINGLGGILGNTLNLGSLVVAGRNTVNIASGVVVQTANFTVAQSSNAVVSGTVQLQASATAASTFFIDSSSALYVSASGAVQAGATNIVAQGQANVAGTITTTGSYAQTAGNLVLNATATAANAVVISPSITIGASATLSGNGVLGGSSASAAANVTVQIDGNVNVGQSPGVVTINGDWRPSATSTFTLEVASSSSFDRLVVTGTAYCNGVVKAVLLNNYVPTDNTRFSWLSASATQGNFVIVGTGSSFGKWSSSITSNSAIANYNSAVSVAVSGLVLIACVLASLM